MTQIRIGIVGCGEVVQIIHLPSLYQLGEKFQVTAVCDVSPTVLEGVGSHWNVAKQFYDYRELIEQDDVDAVLVANPHVYHADVTLAALAAGKHVLVEKPMCLTLDEADAIIAARQETNLVVQVGYMRRYAPAFTHACQLVRELDDICLARVHDVIGQNALIIGQTARVIRGKDIPADLITVGHTLQHDWVREAIGDAPPELERAYMLLLGLSSHDVSAMREMLGMPEGVLYAAQRYGGAYLTAAFDYGSYVCQFETGVNNIPHFDAFLEVYGRNKILKVQYDTPYVRHLPTRLTVTEANDRGGVVEHRAHPAWGDPFVIEWQSFYDNVMSRQDPKSSPADFRQDLELFRDMIALMR